MRLRLGASINGERLAAKGFGACLMNSLIASANGCGRPINPGLFGPFRS